MGTAHVPQKAAGRARGKGPKCDRNTRGPENGFNRQEQLLASRPPGAPATHCPCGSPPFSRVPEGKDGKSALHMCEEMVTDDLTPLLVLAILCSHYNKW